MLSETVIIAIIGLITSVLGGIGIGFKTLYNRITQGMDKCEKDRGELWTKANELTDKVRDLEDRLSDCPATDCPVRPMTPMRMRRNTQRWDLKPES